MELEEVADFINRDRIVTAGIGNAYIDYDDKVVRIARACHEVNRAYCKALGDNTQVDWDHSPEWQQKSAIEGVKFHLQNPSANAWDSHENWLKQKQEDGWTYGMIKDPYKREHPCCVTFDELPFEQKVKVHLFKEVVHSVNLAILNVVRNLIPQLN